MFFISPFPFSNLNFIFFVVMESSELKYLQNLTLEEKILKTQTRIIEWCNYWNWNVYVSFSGGKDSTVLLDMVRKIAKEYKQEVPAVFCDTGLEFPGIKDFVKSVEKVVVVKPTKNFHAVISEYGYPIISKEVAHTIEYARKGSQWALNRLEGLDKHGNFSILYNRYKKYKYLLNFPFKVSAKCCYFLKKSSFMKYEKYSGRKCITAMMAEESFLRRSSWLKHGCNRFSGVYPKSNPMSFWLQQDVLKYITFYQIPYAKSVYGDIVFRNKKLVTSECERTGCVFCLFGIHNETCPNRMQLLKKQYPKLYKYCMNNLRYEEVLDFLNISVTEVSLQQLLNFDEY
jgi:3'-phosphoadenosine 5'-phosphosulfate sulfotransferase (PAPS reductase)/FAD synthetase